MEKSKLIQQEEVIRQKVTHELKTEFEDEKKRFESEKLAEMKQKMFKEAKEEVLS